MVQYFGSQITIFFISSDDRMFISVNDFLKDADVSTAKQDKIQTEKPAKYRFHNQHFRLVFQ